MNEDVFSQFFEGESFDFEANKKATIANLDWLKSLSVEEFTFYKKYQEILECREMVANAGLTKSAIWRPLNINDEGLTIAQIEGLKPIVICTAGIESADGDWLNLRIFAHSAEHVQAPCRFLKFLVLNAAETEKTEILGFFSVASDVISIKDRDNYIGWTHEQRVKEGRLNHSVIATTIAATQPFGFNFLGNKLVASLVPSDVMRESMKNTYGDTIVGVTTTSLYGVHSMYQRIPHWHECGESAGKISIKPDEKFYAIWHDWLKKNRSEAYSKMMTQKEGVSGPVTSAKMRVLHMIFDELGVKQSQYDHGHQRGVFYSCAYENTRDFLCGKITEDALKLKPIFVDHIQTAVNWWKPKAIARYKKLKAEGRIKPEILYYKEMMDMTYTQAKAIYFNDVGR